MVYEDTGESARDHGAAIEDTIQYYTVFSYDDNGNVSSGAVVAIRIDKDGATIVDIDEIIDETLDELGLTLTDFEFLQDERVLPQEENTVYIDGAKQLTIRISYELLPEHLKSILVTLVDPEDRDKVFSFLLRIDKEREYYTATLAPLGVSGVFPIRIAVFDFKTQQVGYADGSLVSTISFAAEPKKGFLAYLLERIFTLEVGMFLLFLLFLLSLLFIARR